MQAKRSRTPGCDYLARVYVHSADAVKLLFDEENHTYTFHCVVVEKSCTALVSENFAIFDAWKTVKTHYEKWKLSKDER